MQAFPICFSQICLSLNGYKYSFFSGMFRCSDTTFVTFENRKFCFLDWLYFCFTCIQFSRCKLFWRFDPSKPNNEYLSQPCVEKCLRKPFVMLRITHVFAPQTYLKPLDFFRFTKKPFVSLRDTHVFAPQTRLKIPRCILQAVCTAKF